MIHTSTCIHDESINRPQRSTESLWLRVALSLYFSASKYPGQVFQTTVPRTQASCPVDLWTDLRFMNRPWVATLYPLFWKGGAYCWRDRRGIAVLGGCNPRSTCRGEISIEYSGAYFGVDLPSLALWIGALPVGRFKARLWRDRSSPPREPPFGAGSARCTVLLPLTNPVCCCNAVLSVASRHPNNTEHALPRARTHNCFQLLPSSQNPPLAPSSPPPRTRTCISSEKQGRCSNALNSKDFCHSRWSKRRAEEGLLSKPGILHISLFNLTLEGGREGEVEGGSRAEASVLPIFHKAPS